MYSEAQKLRRMLVPSVQSVKGVVQGQNSKISRGDSKLDLGEYIVFRYKEVNGPGQV